MRNAQYLRTQADLCLELARQLSDSASVASLTEEAARYRAEAAGVETGQKTESKGSAHGFARADVRSRMRAKDDRALKEKRGYYRLLRHLLGEKLEASYREDQARPLPPHLLDLLKTLEYPKSPTPDNAVMPAPRLGYPRAADAKRRAG